jgi:4-carboxymuconolactone decarboxylase
MTDEERLKQGFAVRRAVLGDAHVDRAEANKTALTADFQSFITRYAWGEIWSRPGLDRHTRSLITVAMMIALNRNEELAMHLRAAFNNGVTEQELSEVILNSSLYCGLPAANVAYHLLQDVVTARQTSTR